MMKSCVTISLVEEARGGPFVYWDDLATSCQKAAALGFDAVEIFAPSAEAVNASELQTLLTDHNLRLAAVGTGAGWVKHQLQLADVDAGRREQAQAFVRTIIDLGGPFGAPAIIGSMQGRSTAAVPPDEARRYLADALNELGEYAQQYQVPLIYEPLNRYETNQVNTVADALALLNGLGDHNVKLLCDLFHMNIEESDLAGALRAAGPLIGHVHFVDSNRRPVGLGHLDMRAVIAALRETQYSGYLSAEAFPYPTPDEAAAQTLRAFRYWTQSATGEI